MAPRPQSPTDLRQSAAAAGLTYADTDAPGLGRRRTARSFTYLREDGRTIRDPEALSRLRALAIPPAWTSVWICPSAAGHIQAIGYDHRGRRQYLYHPRFREAREGAKFEHLMAFAKVLPLVRARVARDMATPGRGRAKVLASVAGLLDATTMRVGNEAYVRQNHSYGLTTLRGRHVEVDGAELKFHFKGKSGKTWRLNLRDRRIARVVKDCQELPGQHLFQYLDEDGEAQAVTSADVNAYLQEATGAEITAKDFRTWTGTVLAAMMLAEAEAAGSQAGARREIARVVKRVAARLGNTPAICRRCYIHPEVIAAYEANQLRLVVRAARARTLRPEETAVLGFLSRRLARAGQPSSGATSTSTSRVCAPGASSTPSIGATSA